MRYQSEGGIYAGNLLIDVFVNGVRTGAERDVGECSVFTINAMKVNEKTKPGHRLENYGNTVDSTILGKPQDMKFSLGDNANKLNRALAAFGIVTDLSQTSAAVTAEAVTANLGKYAKLAKRKIKTTPAPVVKAATPDAWAQGTYALGAFIAAGSTYRAECTAAGTTGSTQPTWTNKVPGDTVTDGSVTWTIRKLTFAADTDYEMENDEGMILSLEDGDIPDGEALKVDYSCEDFTGYNIKASTQAKIDAYLRLIGKNVVSGKRCTVIVHRASLVPTGVVDYITEDYGKLEFTGNIMALDNGDTWEEIGLD